MAALALFLNTMHMNQVTCSSDSYPSFCPVHTQNLVFVGSQVIQRSFATSEKQVWSYVSNHRQQLVPERNAVPVLPNRCDQAVINTLREYRHWPSVMLPLLSPEPITLLLSSPTSPKRKAATFFICLQTALRLKFNQLLGRIYYSFLLPCASATQQCMLSSPVVDYKCFSPFNVMVDFQNLEGFHKCHTCLHWMSLTAFAISWRVAHPVSLHAFEQQHTQVYFTSLCPKASQCCPKNQRSADARG